MAQQKKSAAQTQLDTANAQLKKLGSFSYSDNAGLSAAHKAAYNDYNNWLNNANQNGLNAYLDDVNRLYSDIMNQQKFSYDPQKDALFQLYKQQYTNQGDSAMRNQMGAASAFSGGYNSSAAQTSAQSTYQNYLNALSEKAAETYKNALDMYKYKQQNLLDRFGTASNMNTSSNDAFWKQADAKAQRMNSAYNSYNDDKNFQYNRFSADRSFYQNQGKNAQDQINWLNEYKLKKKQYGG